MSAGNRALERAYETKGERDGVAWDVQGLFRQHARCLTLTHRGASADLAEDMTQDVFVRLLTREGDDGRDPGPLLFRSARTLMIDQLRRDQLRGRIEIAMPDLEESADPAPLPEQRLHDRLRLERTARALMEVPERTRRAAWQPQPVRHRAGWPSSAPSWPRFWSMRWRATAAGATPRCGWFWPGSSFRTSSP